MSIYVPYMRLLKTENLEIPLAIITQHKTNIKSMELSPNLFKLSKQFPSITRKIQSHTLLLKLIFLFCRIPQYFSFQ